jgi:hypothetical protein
MIGVGRGGRNVDRRVEGGGEGQREQQRWREASDSLLHDRGSFGNVIDAIGFSNLAATS